MNFFDSFLTGVGLSLGLGLGFILTLLIFFYVVKRGDDDY